MKAELMAMNSRMNIKQEWISDLGDWIISIILSGQQTESQMKKKTTRNNTRDVWDSIKHANVHMIGIPEGGEKEKGIENAF